VQKEEASQPFTKMHNGIGGHSAMSLEMACKELKLMNRRYSASNLKNIHDAHARYFGCLDKSPLDIKMEQSKLQEEAIARDLRRNRKTDLGRRERKKKRKQQKRVDCCRLYYEPRKTCRERSIEDDDDDEEEEGNCSCEPECISSKCVRCGVELAPTTLTPKSSTSGLSLYSIAACGKNKELLQFTSDICDQCGFVHNQHSPCPMLTESTTSRTMQQLRQIKQISQCSDGFSHQSSLRVFPGLQRICS